MHNEERRSWDGLNSEMLSGIVDRTMAFSSSATKGNLKVNYLSLQIDGIIAGSKLAAPQ